MAFHDENGKITIDENMALRDVRRMIEAVEKLKASRSAIQSLKANAADMQGMAATAIVEKAVESERELTKTRNQIEEAIQFINKTVEHYRLLDKKLSEAMNATDLMHDVVNLDAIVNK